MVLDTDSSIFSVFVMFNLYCRFVYIVQVFVHLFAALFYLLAIQGDSYACTTHFMGQLWEISQCTSGNCRFARCGYTFSSF